MPKSAPHSGSSRDAVIRLNGDRLGMIAATFAATVVMALGFYRELDALVVAVRMGITFVVTYVVVFVFVRIVYGILMSELWAAKERARQAAEAEDADDTAQTGGNE